MKIVFIISLLFLSCCKKQIPALPGMQLSEFASVLFTNTFHISGFYTDDANLYDSIPSYLIDDTYMFTTSVLIDQGAVTMLGAEQKVFAVPYSAYATADGKIIFEFIDFDYTPASFELLFYNSTGFILRQVNKGINVYIFYAI